MPEIRIDPLSGRRTIVADERSRRPGGAPGLPPALLGSHPIDPAADPFADGNEDRTPPELYALRPAGGPRDSGGWEVRVVPNLYPALAPQDAGAESDGRRHADSPPLSSHGRSSADELFASRPASGAHEVIINGPQPVFALGELPL